MINRYASLKQGLVGCWCPSVSGSFGYRLPDLSGYGNHGTLTNMDPGTDWVPSGGKLALDFDGVNDYVLLDKSIFLGTTHTTASWVNLITPVPFNFQGICGDGTSNTCSLASSGTTSSLTQLNYSWVATSVSVTVPDFVNKWTHIVTVRKNDTVEFFYNGSFVGSVNGSGIPSFTLKWIGQRNPGVVAMGKIDDFRIYSRPLTPSEIRLLYTGGRGVGLMPERTKHRRKTTAAATNRRRRLICGANC